MLCYVDKPFHDDIYIKKKTVELYVDIFISIFFAFTFYQHSTIFKWNYLSNWLYGKEIELKPKSINSSSYRNLTIFKELHLN